MNSQHIWKTHFTDDDEETCKYIKYKTILKHNKKKTKKKRTEQKESFVLVNYNYRIDVFLFRFIYT